MPQLHDLLLLGSVGRPEPDGDWPGDRQCSLALHILLGPGARFSALDGFVPRFLQAARDACAETKDGTLVYRPPAEAWTRALRRVLDPLPANWPAVETAFAAFPRK